MRIVVITPFLDRRHGTERCVVEQLERIALQQQDVEIHLYAQRVEDMHGVVQYGKASSPSGIRWHQVRSLRGPHLLDFLWWLTANHAQRLWDSRVNDLNSDLVYSPGINARDADAITVHIVFHELYAQVRSQLSFRAAPIASWPRLIHRLLYYQVIMALERRIYPHVPALAAVSERVAAQLAKHFQRSDAVVIRNGVDAMRFSPAIRRARREAARAELSLSPNDFVPLLIGNDWRNKGLRPLLFALSSCRDVPFKLLVVGTDEQTPYQALMQSPELTERVRFLAPSPDVMQFFAAADAYVGPSLEDAYGLPVLEAMASGLPVIASSRAGVSEIIEHGKSGLVLRNPEDSQELAQTLRTLYGDPELRQRMGDMAALTAQENSWEHNASKTWEFLQRAAAARRESSM